MPQRLCPISNVPLSAKVQLPGSKSITNRLLILAALADGSSLLQNMLFAEDTRVMIAGLRTLGVRLTLDEAGGAIEVTGCRGHLPVDQADLHGANSGTTTRFLLALAALGQGEFRLDCLPRMRQRPVGGLVEALRDLGAQIDYAAEAGFPPLTIRGCGLQGGMAAMVAPPSSQLVSGLLMVAPYAASDVMIEVRGLPSAPYVRMTTGLMDQFGVAVISQAPRGDDTWRFIVAAAQRYRGQTCVIEPDATAAANFLAAAAVAGGRMTVNGLGAQSLQGDVHFAQVLEQMGCRVELTPEALTVARGPKQGLRGIDVDLNDMPDTVPTLAVTALFAEGPTTIRGVANLRVKESDRISALAGELRKLGAAIDEHDDGLTIHPPAVVMPAVLNPHNDHRLAMSFALAGLGCPGIEVRDAECCAKTYPNFWSDWAAMLQTGAG